MANFLRLENLGAGYADLSTNWLRSRGLQIASGDLAATNFWQNFQKKVVSYADFGFSLRDFWYKTP